MTNETAATGGVMYVDEGPYTIDIRHLCLASIAKFCDEEMARMTREAADGDRVWRARDGDETGNETGGSRERDRQQDGGDGRMRRRRPVG